MENCLNHIFRKCISMALLILVLSVALSARGEYFRHLTLGDGLSQTSVMAITQDKLGRMWLGTREGVNVYDGVTITPYKGWISSGTGNERTWIGNEVSAIVTDSIGNIFIMIDKDIVKFELLTDKFTRFTNNEQINALAENDGEVVYISRDSIMVKNRHNDVSRLAFTIPPVKKISHLSVDKKNFYISTSAGIHLFDRKTQSHKVFLPNEDIYSSFISRDGTLWITSVDNGLYRLAKGDNEPVAVSELPRRKVCWEHDNAATPLKTAVVKYGTVLSAAYSAMIVSPEKHAI